MMLHDAWLWSMIDVLIAARNEEKTVAGVIRPFKRAPLIGNVIVVDNASTDDTYYRAVSAGAKVISCKTPGKGQALTAGLRLVTTSRVIFIDADLINVDASTVAILAQNYEGMLVGIVDACVRSSGQRSLPTALARMVSMADFNVEHVLLIAAMKLGIPISYVELPNVTQHWVPWVKAHGHLPPELEHHFDGRFKLL